MGFKQSTVCGRSGETFRTINPATGEVLAEVEIAGAPEVEPRRRGGARAARRVWAAMTGRRARPRPEAAPPTSCARATTSWRGWRRSTPASRSRRRRRSTSLSGADCLEYFAGLAGDARRRARRSRPGRLRLYAARAARRRRRHRRLELSDPDRLLEVGAGARLRQRHDLQAGGADAAHRASSSPRSYARPACRTASSTSCRAMRRTGRAARRAIPASPRSRSPARSAPARRVMADAAQTLKHVTLELGGKSPLIVFDDAELDNAVSGALLGNFYSAGEVCSNGTRVFVHSAASRTAFLEQARRRASSGWWSAIRSTRDPCRRADLARSTWTKVLGYIERGRAEGAQRADRRRAASRDGALARGLLRRADGVRRLHRRHGDRARGDLRAGDDRARLRRGGRGRSPAPTPPNTASPPASSPATSPAAHRVIARLEAGTCWINHYNVTPIELPFGGVKLSGLGRENGTRGDRALHAAQERLRRARRHRGALLMGARIDDERRSTMSSSAPARPAASRRPAERGRRATACCVLEYRRLGPLGLHPDAERAVHPDEHRRSYNWRYQTEPEPHLGGRRLHTPRGKVLGGSSSINGMVYVRGNPLDFERWEEAGAAGWGYARRAALFPAGREPRRRAATPIAAATGPLQDALRPARATRSTAPSSRRRGRPAIRRPTTSTATSRKASAGWT